MEQTIVGVLIGVGVVLAWAVMEVVIGWPPSPPRQKGV